MSSRRPSRRGRMARKSAWGSPHPESAIHPDRLRARDRTAVRHEMIDPDGLGLGRRRSTSAGLPHRTCAAVLADLQHLLSARTRAAWQRRSMRMSGSILGLVSANRALGLTLSGLPLVITLQTPAPRRWTHPRPASSGQRPRDKLHVGYQRVSPSFRMGPTSQWFFACRPFRAPISPEDAPGTSGNYFPFVPTVAGSTFVLRADGDAAAHGRRSQGGWLMAYPWRRSG